MKRKRFDQSQIQAKLTSWIISIFLWTLLTILVVKVDPRTVSNYPWTGSYGLFFLLCGAACFSLVYNLTRSLGRAGLWSLLIELFFMLSLVGLGNMVNFILIFALLCCIEFLYRFR